MRDTSRQLSDGGHLVRLDQLHLRPFQLFQGRLHAFVQRGVAQRQTAGSAEQSRRLYPLQVLVFGRHRGKNRPEGRAIGDERHSEKARRGPKVGGRVDEYWLRGPGDHPNHIGREHHHVRLGQHGPSLGHDQKGAGVQQRVDSLGNRADHVIAPQTLTETGGRPQQVMHDTQRLLQILAAPGIHRQGLVLQSRFEGGPGFGAQKLKTSHLFGAEGLSINPTAQVENVIAMQGKNRGVALVGENSELLV